MGRRSIKRNNKLSYNKVLFKKNNMYINNISIAQMLEIIDTPENEDALTIVNNIIMSCLAMMIMSQIAISALPEDAEYVDQLPSYKDIKKKFISSRVGRSLAACAAIATAYPYLMQDKMMQDDSVNKVIHIITDLVESSSPNIKRIKPNVADWQAFAKGEIGACMGQMLSCPATNIKVLNLNGKDLKEYGLAEALLAIGIPNKTLDSFGINPITLSHDMKGVFLINNAGIPIESISYDEPSKIYSKIQNELLGSSLIRNGIVNTNLVKGLESESSITKAQVEQFLSKYELIAYNFAIRSGDKNILKKYTELVKQRSTESKKPD